MWMCVWRVGRVSVTPSPRSPMVGGLGEEGGGGVRVGGSFWCGVVWFKVVRCVFALPLLSPPAPLWWGEWGGRGGRGWGGWGLRWGGDGWVVAGVAWGGLVSVAS